eukprot:m.98705 g.98705  ORF g.98705 m.98705 type:complete len:66 (+) comp27090_c0_seq1:1005-1202(+)
MSAPSAIAAFNAAVFCCNTAVYICLFIVSPIEVEEEFENTDEDVEVNALLEEVVECIVLCIQSLT